MSPTKQLILNTDQNAYLAPIQGWKQSVQKLESRTETFKGYVNKPGGTYWEGQFAEAAQQNAGDGLKTVGSIRDTIDALADEVTSTVTYSVLPPLTAAKAIINHAEQQQGVTVNDDLSMTYTPPSGMSDEAVEKSRQAVATMAKELKDSADKWWAATQTVKGQIEAGEGKIAGELNLAAATFNVNNAAAQAKPADVPGAKDGNFYKDWYPRSSTPATTEAAAATAVDPNAPKVGPPSPGDRPLQPDPRTGGLTANLGALGITEPKSPLEQQPRPADPRTTPAPKLDPSSPQGKAAIDQMRGYLQKIYPPAEAEQRLQEAIKGAQQDRPMVAVPESGPQERVKETFKDAYRASWDEGIKGIQDMVGANGLDDFKDAWKNTGEGLLHQLNPVNNVIDSVNEIKAAIDNPEAALGHKSAIASQMVPGLLLGGEGALARAGLEDAALTGARSELTHGIPDTPGTHHAPVDHPAPSAVEHHAPPTTGDHHVPSTDSWSGRNAFDSSGQLSSELRDQIVSIEKGGRPDPATYLPNEYIQQHLTQFDKGVARFMTDENLDSFGIGQRDGTSFVMPKSEADALMNATRGNPRAMEDALGLPEGFLDKNRIVRVDIEDPRSYDLRMPSGNEAGANSQWIPGGRLPNGDSEAIIDGGRVPTEDYKISDIAGR